MALPGVVDSLDGIEEPVRKFYAKGEDGKFVLDVDVESHPTTAGLRTTKDKERADRKKAETALKAYQDSGLSPEQITELVKKGKPKGEHDATPDVDKLIEKRVKEAVDALQPDLKERDELKSENRKLKLTDKVRAAFIAAGGIEEDAEDVLRITEAQFDLKDGKVVVIDEDGDPTSMDPKKWFETVYKVKKPKYFKGKDASGSGARSGDGGSGAGDLDKLSPTQRLTEARRRGITK